MPNRRLNLHQSEEGIVQRISLVKDWDIRESGESKMGKYGVHDVVLPLA